MTMRNAVPTFGMRSVVVLALVAMVALAAFLAVRSPAPASAQTVIGGRNIESATMTVGDFHSIGKGWTPRHGGIGAPLSDNTWVSSPASTWKQSHVVTLYISCLRATGEI